MVINALDSVTARHFKLRDIFSPVKSILNLLAIKNKVKLVVILMKPQDPSIITNKWR
jgi:hypothetical protein